jgi:hypothetical protein
VKSLAKALLRGCGNVDGDAQAPCAAGFTTPPMIAEAGHRPPLRHRGVALLAPLTLVRAVALIALAATALSAGAHEPTPFARIGGDHPARSVPARPATDIDLPLSAVEARTRLDTVLTAEGFQPTDADPSPTAVSYVRFDDREGFHGVADCRGPALGTPELWLETLVVDIAPAPVGVHLTTTGQFQVVMKRLVSGVPFKLSCRSLGRLEARVRDALARP